MDNGLADRPYSRARLAGLLALVVFCVAFGLSSLARAEDAQDIRGTHHGCVDTTVPAAWTAFTSASLENTGGAAALGASLWWTEILVKGGDAAVYVCTTTAASCGTGTANKISVPTGGTLMLPLRGLNTRTVSIYGTGVIGSTIQLCGYFRVQP